MVAGSPCLEKTYRAWNLSTERTDKLEVMLTDERVPRSINSEF